EVLPDRHGVPPPRDRLGDQLAIRLARTRTRRPAWTSLLVGVAGHLARGGRFWPLEVGEHLRRNGRFCRGGWTPAVWWPVLAARCEVVHHAYARECRNCVDDARRAGQT